MIPLAMEVFRCISTVLCLLEIAASQKIKPGIAFQVHSKAASIGDARVICMDKGATCRLPVYQTDDEILSIQSKMKASAIDTTWLAITKRRFSSFKWLDETRMDLEFEAQHWRDYMRCGTLHLRDRILEADNCTIGYYGYVCQTEDLDWCLRGQVPGSKCLNFLKKTFILGCSVENWYDAKYQCERRGMTLATHLHRDVIEYLSKTWYGTKRCSQVWVGFRKDDWVLLDNGSPDEPLRYFWGQGQPRYDKDCAVITRNKKNTFSWHVESCNSSSPFFCVCPGVTEEALRQVTESTSEPLRAGGSMEVFKITGIILLVILSIAAAVTGFIILKIKRNIPPQQINSDLQKLTKGESNWQSIHERPDDVVVINKTESMTKEGHPEQDEDVLFSVEETQQPKHVSLHYIKEKEENEDYVIISTSDLQMASKNAI